MKEIKTIMVAVSLSSYSQGKFDFTAHLAKALDANILVVNIINSRDVDALSQIASMGYDLDVKYYVDEMKKDRMNKIDEIITTSGFPMERVRKIVRVGNPIDKLLDTIHTEDIHLVVMGPKGRTDLEHILMGSVAEKVFRRSPVTIISYRDEKISHRMRKVVCG